VKPGFSLVESYTSKKIVFKFRGEEIRFALSHGLFSSAGIDRGTAFLLKILSRMWDEDRAAGRSPPRRILDAGCGAGIIAVCAAAALRRIYHENADPAANAGEPAGTTGAAEGISPCFHIRAQDRDELARSFTEYNARTNGISPFFLSAYTEPLLASPPGARWDLILSNIPAKAGTPVLEDFVRRSALLLHPGGKAAIVAVHTLADFFRSLILKSGGTTLREETGAEHTVFVYSRPESGRAVPQAAEPVQAGENLLKTNLFYLRQRKDYTFEDIPVHLDTIHGAPGFDRPGGAAEAAARLALRLGEKTIFPAPSSLLIHEPGQGWFPAWLLAFQKREGENSGRPCPVSEIILSGRNILALEAARHNTRHTPRSIRSAGETAALHPEIRILLAAELSPQGLAGLFEDRGGSSGMAETFCFIAAFPETVPRTDRRDALWEGLAAFLLPGGAAIVSLPSSEAERFDRKKTPGFRRLGDLKRNGFRALAYGKAAAPY
jgi:16S rRNA G1207 methylase RsmC